MQKGGNTQRKVARNDIYVSLSRYENWNQKAHAASPITVECP